MKSYPTFVKRAAEKTRKTREAEVRAVVDAAEYGPVKRIKPPKTKEPAELCTIATILLRKNRVLAESKHTKDSLACLSYLSRSMERQLTEKEAERAIAHIAVLKGSK